MLKLLSGLKPKARAEIVDATKIYQKIMGQSRLPVFYGDGLVADSYDGRMEMLCMHLSVVMNALTGQGENGAKLNQAIYDVMIDNFDVALREEGLSDTGVSRRIKPLAKMFYARAEMYWGELAKNDGEFTTIVKKHILDSEGEPKAESVEKFTAYIKGFAQNLDGLNLGDIARARFSFPKL